MKKQILILTHGNFAKGIRTSLRVITGETDLVDCVCLSEEDSVEKIHNRIKNWISKNDTEIPSLIITDIPFGSTTSLAVPFINIQKNLHIISGLNLGMLLSLVTTELTTENINEKINDALEQGKQSISYINTLIKDITDREDDF